MQHLILLTHLDVETTKEFPQHDNNLDRWPNNRRWETRRYWPGLEGWKWRGHPCRRLFLDLQKCWYQSGRTWPAPGAGKGAEGLMGMALRAAVVESLVAKPPWLQPIASGRWRNSASDTHDDVLQFSPFSFLLRSGRMPGLGLGLGFYAWSWKKKKRSNLPSLGPICHTNGETCHYFYGQNLQNLSSTLSLSLIFCKVLCGLMWSLFIIIGHLHFNWYIW